MEKTYNAAEFIGKDFLGCTFWFPGTSHGFRESTQNFSPPTFSLRPWLISERKKKNNLKSIQELLFSSMSSVSLRTFLCVSNCYILDRNHKPSAFILLC